MSSCVDKYNTVIEADVAVAFDALDKGDYKFAEQYINEAANETDSCEKDFSRSSPLTHVNKDMHDVAAIASAIVRVLMDS